jgi:hypothetical protein
MKKNLSLVISLSLIFSYAYASFPVVSNAVQSEVVLSSNHKASMTAPPAEFHFGGVILGLLLGLLGVGLAYIFSDNPDFRRNAWYGCGTWVLLYLIIVAGAA